MLWFGTGFNADPEPAFRPMGLESGSRNVMTKNSKTKNSYFFSSKLAIHLYLGLYEGRPSWRKSLHKKDHPNPTLPSWIRIQPTKINADPDPQHCFQRRSHSNPRVGWYPVPSPHLLHSSATSAFFLSAIFLKNWALNLFAKSRHHFFPNKRIIIYKNTYCDWTER